MASRQPLELEAAPIERLGVRPRADSTPIPYAIRTVVVAGATVRVHATFVPPRPPSTSSSHDRGPQPAPASPAALDPRPHDAPPPAGAARPASEPTGAAAIRPQDLTPEVRRLLWYHLDTVEKIAVLDHARRAALPWTLQQAASALGVAERSLMLATVGLCQAGLLRRSGDTYDDAPKTALVSAALDVLHRAYGHDPRLVLGAIGRLARGRSAT